MINTNNWKEFRVGDLFPFQKVNKFSKKPASEGPIEFVTSSSYNNGVSYYCDENTIAGNCITVSTNGKCFDCFYHRNVLAVSTDVEVLYSPFLNEYNGLFICSVLQQEQKKYDFKDKPKNGKVFDTLIKLPATTDGRPDWDYMESYMKAVMEESEKSLENLKRADSTKHPIDVSGWGEFRIDDVFNIVKGTRLTKADMKDGTIKFVGSSAMNNGETHRIANNEKLHPANTITVCYNGSVGETFYQDEKFWASDDVNVLYPKFDMTKEMAMFVCPIIKSAGQKYAFVDKWKQEDMKNEVIKLPIDANGKPDWQYMEDYMQKQFKEAESAISKLQLAV